MNSLFESRVPVGSKKYHDWPSNVVAWVHFVTYRGGRARADIKKIGFPVQAAIAAISGLDPMSEILSQDR